VDPQATASKWTDRRTEELPWVVPTHAVRLGAAIEQAKAQGVDLIVIDTPPHSSTDAAQAARPPCVCKSGEVPEVWPEEPAEAVPATDRAFCVRGIPGTFA
jgi:hypothetical protein